MADCVKGNYDFVPGSGIGDSSWAGVVKSHTSNHEGLGLSYFPPPGGEERIEVQYDVENGLMSEECYGWICSSIFSFLADNKKIR